MNIFFLALCVRECAQAHFDSHVIKMILELTQLLSTAWHMLNEKEAQLYLAERLIYRKTHYNHPCAKWTREHINNYNFVAELAHELCEEWRYRWQHDKIHKCEPMLDFLFDNAPPNIPKFSILKTKTNPHCLTFPMPQAMPEECRFEPQSTSMMACVTAYRRYYVSDHKKHLRSWSVANIKDGIRLERFRLDPPKWFADVSS